MISIEKSFYEGLRKDFIRIFLQHNNVFSKFRYKLLHENLQIRIQISFYIFTPLSCNMTVNIDEYQVCNDLQNILGHIMALYVSFILNASI